ncbi:MAG: selenide, water dikinase SelD [Deltaproteobacteria bacterium]|nr:selenide, water dikinase SelD [Deltaproteobacteria bacterium]
MVPMNVSPRADIVLVGGGHAHVQVIRRWMMDPLLDVRLTVVLDRPAALYSGMVPGVVAGEYDIAEAEIDVVPLARRARARVILAAASRIVPSTRSIELVGRPPLHYDAASLDVGSTVRGTELPGVREHALATRPIREFVDRVDGAVARMQGVEGGPRISIVGGGAAGVELAFTLDTRLRSVGTVPAIEILTDAPILSNSSARLRRATEAALRERGIRLVTGVRVAAVEEKGVRLEGGDARSADLVVWATGAAPVPLLGNSPLPLDKAGFVRVASSFEVEGADGLFAVGDCASLTDHAWVPKAGVHAVRAGPTLDANLRATLSGRPLRRHRPQRDFLALLNLGGGRAIGGKWGFAFSAGAVWRLKDRIDRRFMERFQVLEANGAAADAFPTPEEMGMEEMPCGGCAAKVGAHPLSRALARLAPASLDDRVIVGLDAPDDAAAVRTLTGDVVLATVDGFRAFTDDPWWVGRVAAINAVSDVQAKGGTPRHALALVTIPDEDETRAEETLFQVLSGLRTALDPLGVSLIGGHTTQGPELFVGLSIMGDAPTSGPLPLGALESGDVLVLTAALGTGVVLAADMQGRARGSWFQAVLAHMARSNANAGEVATRLARSATDVSGFGLAGHLGEMLEAGGRSANLFVDALPLLPGARALLEAGVRSSFHDQNAEGRRGIAWDASLDDRAVAEVIFDPQTSGGLLLAVPRDALKETLSALHAGGDSAAAEIGTVEPMREDGARFAVLERGVG